MFGDAATATVLVSDTSGLLVHRPILSKPEPGEALFVPISGDGQFVRMKGGRVFSEAVREMTGILQKVCRASGLQTTISTRFCRTRRTAEFWTRWRCEPDGLSCDIGRAHRQHVVFKHSIRRSRRSSLEARRRGELAYAALVAGFTAAGGRCRDLTLH